MFTGRDGEPVDPVPFLVVAATGLLMAVSFMPVYVLALGGSQAVGVGAALLAAGAFTALAYRWMVTGRSEQARREVPPAERLRTIVYGVLVVVALLAGLSLLAYLA